jgi:polyisoprenoid-binding protein YceI
MFRAVVILALALVLSGCDAVDALKEGMQQAQAVEGDLELSTGIRPRVGFNWRNGRLASVTVMFPRLYQTKPIGDLAGPVREAVTREFKQTPDAIVLSFALDKGPAV